MICEILYPHSSAPSPCPCSYTATRCSLVGEAGILHGVPRGAQVRGLLVVAQAGSAAAASAGGAGLLALQHCALSVHSHSKYLHCMLALRPSAAMATQTCPPCFLRSPCQGGAAAAGARPGKQARAIRGGPAATAAAERPLKTRCFKAVMLNSTDSYFVERRDVTCAQDRV